MGNSICYTYGRKTTIMLNTLLTQDYDRTKTPNDKVIKDLIEYLENNLNKLYQIGGYAKDQIDQACRGLKSRKQAIHFNTILNAFQMNEHILKSVQRFVKTRRELAEVHNKAAIVKMKLKRSHRLKTKWASKRVDSYFLVNYLRFQEVVFRSIKKMLAEDFTLKNAVEGRNEVELFKLILRNWREIFAIWKTYELQNFDRNIKKIFESTSVRTQLFLNNEVITSTLEDIFSVCPIKMIRKSKNELLASIESVLLIKEEQTRIRGVKMLYALLLNIIANKDLVLVNGILMHYSDNRPEIIYYLIGVSKNSMDIQEMLLEIIIEKIKTQEKYFELLYKLISTSPSNLLNYSNMILLTDKMITFYERPNIKPEEKYTFFAAFAERASQNVQIGLLAFFKNLFIQLLIRKSVQNEIYSSIVEFMNNKPKLQEAEFLDKNIIRFIFDLTETSIKYLKVLSLLLKLKTVQGNKIETSLVFKFIIHNLISRADDTVRSVSENSGSLFRFIWFMRTHLHLQTIIHGEKNEISLYIEFLVHILGKTTNVFVLLFVFFALYEFSKTHSVNENVLKLMEKYDDLLEKEIYKKCLILLKSDVVEFSKEDMTKLNNEIEKDKHKFSQDDVNWLIRTLKDNYGIVKNTDDTIIIDPTMEDIVEPVNKEVSYSIFDKTVSQTNSNDNYTLLANKDVNELYQINFKKNQEIVNGERFFKL